MVYNMIENNLIEKSKRLVWARFNNYTAGELRLLEVYLSRINPRDPESYTVCFTFDEYSKLMDFSEVRVDRIQTYLNHFVSNAVSIEEKRSDGRLKWTHYALFSKATCDIDPDLGCYVVTIQCNSELKDVFFNLAEDGYIRYRLRYTKDMRRKYSIKLYSMLRDWLHAGRWQASLKYLRQELDVDEKSYKEFKKFRVWVIDRAVEEINALSDIQVNYSTITTGRKVTDLIFAIKAKPTQKFMTEYAEILDAEMQEHDGAWYAAATDNQMFDSAALKLADAVRSSIHGQFPQISFDQLDYAAKDTIRLAFISIIKNRDDFAEPINDIGKVLWSVLITHKGYADYIPSSYF